jgi:hypothetical protein
MAWTLGTLPARATSAANPSTATQAVLVGETVFALLLKVRGAAVRGGGAPTWNGHTFAQAGTTQRAAASPEVSAEVWYLLNMVPSTGLLSIPNTGALTMHWQIVMLRAGSGVASLHQALGANGTSTNPTPGTFAAAPTGQARAAVSIAASGATNFSPATADILTLISANDDGADGGATAYGLSVGAVSAGFTFGTSDDWGAVAAAFAEEPAVRMQNYLQVSADSGMAVGEKIR